MWLKRTLLPRRSRLSALVHLDCPVVLVVRTEPLYVTQLLLLPLLPLLPQHPASLQPVSLPLCPKPPWRRLSCTSLFRMLLQVTSLGVWGRVFARSTTYRTRRFRLLKRSDRRLRVLSLFGAPPARSVMQFLPLVNELLGVVFVNLSRRRLTKGKLAHDPPRSSSPLPPLPPPLLRTLLARRLLASH